MTLLIHLGYLSYDASNKTCYIPNYEVTSSFVKSIEDSNWQATTRSLQNSRDLSETTLQLPNISNKPYPI